MATEVEQWPPLEVQSKDNLPEYCFGLLPWVLDESGERTFPVKLPQELSLDRPQTEEAAAVPTRTNGNGRYNTFFENRTFVLTNTGEDLHTTQNVQPGQDVPSHHHAQYVQPGDCAPAGQSIQPPEEASPKSPPSIGLAHPKVNHEQHDEVCNEPAKEQGVSPSLVTDHVQPDALQLAADAAREQVIELAAKWKVPEEAVVESAPLAASGSPGSWSISALDEPATPDNRLETLTNDRRTETPVAQMTTKSEAQRSPNAALGSTVAAWIMKTGDAPVSKVVIPKRSSAAHCAEIDPITGNFLPEIEYPETRLNHDMDLQSEPGWRRSNMTSDMQINREMKARARLAERMKEAMALNESHGQHVEEEPSTFPRAGCTIRPATEDDVAGIADMVNADQQARKKNGTTALSEIRNWDIVKLFNRCKKEKRPFIVATGGEDDILDRSKWPDGADAAFREYMRYRSTVSKPQATIVGFAFAAPRQVSSLDTQDVQTNHSCYVNLFVHPDHRNKKYGSALLDRILMSVSTLHRSLIDFEWKCADPLNVYEDIAAKNAKQYARVFVEYLDAHVTDERLASRKQVLEKFGFIRVGQLTCIKSEMREGKRHWLDLLIWELEAQALDNVP